MHRPTLADTKAADRSVDARVAFAIALFIAIASALALLDRIGAPEALVRGLGPLVILMGLATLGMVLRCATALRFYLARRAIPTPYLGFAPLTLLVGLALPFSPPLQGGLSAGVAVAAGIGIAMALLFLGPVLRHAGASSVVDLLGVRFPPLRTAAALLAAAAGLLVAMAGFQSAIAAAMEVFGLSRPVAASLLAAAAVLIAVPGGFNGVLWCASAAAGVLTGAILLPVVLLIARGDMPVPFLEASELWGNAAAQVQAWSGPASVGGWAAVAGAACGMAAILSLFGAAVAARDGRAAIGAGTLTMVWTGLLTAALAASLLWGTLALSRVLTGQRPDRLPDAVYGASAAGLIDICGATAANPAAARQACAERPPDGIAVRPRGAFFLLGVTGLAGAGAAGTSLLAAGLIAAQLVLAAAGLFLSATALTRDFFRRLREPAPLSSRQLAGTRALLVLLAVAAAVAAGLYALDARRLIAWGMMVGAVGALPPLVLFFVRRAGASHASAGLFCSCGAALAVLLVQGTGVAALSHAALAGSLSGVLVGLASSLLRPAAEGPALTAGLAPDEGG